MAWWRTNYYKKVKKGGLIVSLENRKLNRKDTAQVAVALMDRTTRVQTLCLQHNHIGVEGARDIAEALRKNSTLKVLLLDYNNVGNDGAKAMAKALRSNSTLQKLGLSNNSVGDDGTTALAVALRFNSKIQELFLDNNYVGPENATAIANALKCNSTRQELYLYKSDFGVFVAKVTTEEVQIYWNNVGLAVLEYLTGSVLELMKFIWLACEYLTDSVLELMNFIWLACECWKVPENLVVSVAAAVVFHHAIEHHAFERIWCTLVYGEPVQMDLKTDWAKLFAWTKPVWLVYDDIWSGLLNLFFSVTLAVCCHHALDKISITTCCEAGLVLALIVVSHCAVMTFCPLVIVK
jgi:Leucine Rich repeat